MAFLVEIEYNKMSYEKMQQNWLKVGSYGFQKEENIGAGAPICALL